MIMGTWFDDLTNGICSEFLHHFSTLLLTALHQKNTGLLGHLSLDFLITGTDDGYFALYQLAQLGGHPLLNPYPIILREPLQDADTDLASYLANWIQYLMTQALSGHFLSDQYFIVKFVVGLHSSLCLGLGADLERHIDHPRFDNRPLPFDFTPAHLWICLQQRAQFLGLCNQILMAPQEAQQNPSVHQLLNYSPNDAPADDFDHIVAALTTGSSTCFFCHEASHMAPQCPLLLRTKSDPFARRLVIRLLQDQQSPLVSRQHSSLKRSPSGHTPNIHAILADPSDESNHDDITLTIDDEAFLESLLSTATSPTDVTETATDQDFWLAR